MRASDHQNACDRLHAIDIYKIVMAALWPQTARHGAA
jgi:hypothetical protein